MSHIPLLITCTLHQFHIVVLPVPSSIHCNKGTEGTADIYSLSGVRVQKPTKGLYIINGKKVLVK